MADLPDAILLAVFLYLHPSCTCANWVYCHVVYPITLVTCDQYLAITLRSYQELYLCQVLYEINSLG